MPFSLFHFAVKMEKRDAGRLRDVFHTAFCGKAQKNISETVKFFKVKIHNFIL
jgi:hypothetical protein